IWTRSRKADGAGAGGKSLAVGHTATDHESSLTVGRWIRARAVERPPVTDRNYWKDAGTPSQQSDFMSERADLVVIKPGHLLICGNVPDAGFGMSPGHGAEVIDQLLLVETRIVRAVR